MLTTTYNLNSSFTKLVIIGVEFTDAGTLTVKLKFVSSYQRCSISLSSEDWTILKMYFIDIALLFERRSYWKNYQMKNCNLRIKFWCGDNLVSLEQAGLKDSY